MYPKLHLNKARSGISEDYSVLETSFTQTIRSIKCTLLIKACAGEFVGLFFAWVFALSDTPIEMNICRLHCHTNVSYKFSVGTTLLFSWISSIGTCLGSSGHSGPLSENLDINKLLSCCLCCCLWWPCIWWINRNSLTLRNRKGRQKMKAAHTVDGRRLRNHHYNGKFHLKLKVHWFMSTLQ